MSAYYNEIDPPAAAWLRNLIAAGHIAPGDVDERSIEDVRPDDLRGYAQCHFFAGIGGWSFALRLAGVPDDAPVWTGSCPCQPFSQAGQGAGFADERHLWPAWQHLIAQRKPATVFGEQVASKAVDDWIDLVHADMEGLGYAFGSVPFPSAGIGAPHIRDRNYWVAHAHDARLEGWQSAGERAVERPAWPGSLVGGLADATGFRCDEQRPAEAAALQGECTERGGQQARSRIGGQLPGRPKGLGGYGRLADTEVMRRQGKHIHTGGRLPQIGVADSHGDHGDSPLHGFWRSADWLHCRDGKWRPVEPGTFPLAHGVPARVVRLRGYGNAIVPEQAAQFIRASLEAIADQGLPLEAAA